MDAVEAQTFDMKRLNSAKVAEQWPKLREIFLSALPPITCEDSDWESRILAALVGERMQAWALIEAPDHPLIIALTNIVTDEVSLVRNLQIYCLGSVDLAIVPLAAWVEGIETLRKFGEAMGCHRIVAFTSEPRILQIAKHLGGVEQFVFLTFPLTNPNAVIEVKSDGNLCGAA